MQSWSTVQWLKKDAKCAHSANSSTSISITSSYAYSTEFSTTWQQCKVALAYIELFLSGLGRSYSGQDLFRSRPGSFSRHSNHSSRALVVEEYLITINATLIMKVREVIFLCGPFQYTRDNLEIKKVLISMKNYLELPKTVHRITNPTLCFGKCGWLFFFTWAKLLIGYFSGFFMEISSVTRDNLEIKKVSISMKNPSNYLIKSFARLKKHSHIQKERCINS